MAITNGDIIRIALQWFSDGANEQVNVHHFDVVDTGSTVDDLDFMTALAQNLKDNLYDGVVGLVANNILGQVMTGFNVTKNQVLPPVTQTIDGTVASADAYARQVTALVFLSTTTSRRQGRSYLPSFAENAIGDDGAWISGALAGIADYAAKLVSPITDGDISVQRVVTHPDGSSPLTPTFAGFGTFPRTQRRRTPGFGS